MATLKYLRTTRLRRYVNLGEYGKSVDDKISEQSITFEKSDKTFSFGSMDTDLEITENPNLLEDKKFSRLKNDTQLPDDKFDNIADPFYDLDEQESQIEKNEKLDITVTSATKRKLSKRTSNTVAKTSGKVRY
tara:strand:- start:294 stop:692 length:399 start_codon:yes stop_codon:yes gene_type:complete